MFARIFCHTARGIPLYRESDHRFFKPTSPTFKPNLCMFTVIDSAFDLSILTRPGIYGSSQALLTKASLPSAATGQKPHTPPSLWRCALAEDDEHQVHCRWVRAFCALAALLSVGSIGYAMWRLWALLGDDRLHDAVAAFAR